MTTTSVSVRDEVLRAFVVAIFEAAGFSEAHARIEADILVWANLRGVDSHGVFRIPMYIRAIQSGDMNPQPDLQIVEAMGASCTIEADRAAGPVAMAFGMEQAIAIAGTNTIGWALIRNTTHTGPVGYYARQAAECDMIGIATSASKPIMAYHGTRAPAISTNPIAIAAPRAGGSPLVLDMATAAIAWGKLRQARQLGEILPDNVALDAAGQVTTDSALATLPLPLAGAKGAGLSLMIECLTSLLAGVPLLEPVLNGARDAGRMWQHGTAIAVKIAAFTDVERFKADAAALATAIKAQPLADGFDEVLMPGERGDRVYAERCADGIPIPAEQWRQLVDVAKGLGLEPPVV